MTVRDLVAALLRCDADAKVFAFSVLGEQGTPQRVWMGQGTYTPLGYLESVGSVVQNGAYVQLNVEAYRE